MPDTSRHHYRAFGLSIRSDFALPELIADLDPAAPDVTICRVKRVPSVPGLHDLGGGGAAGPGRFELLTRGSAHIAVSGGDSIAVACETDAADATVRALILGSAMGALLLQRGRVPLHASVVAVDGRALAFLGKSGAGKSTLALALGARGCDVLADDLCSPEADFAVSPGVTRLKLWPASLAVAGHDADGLERVWSTWDKRILPPATLPADRAVPLAAIVMLDWSEGEITLTRLTGSAALEALMANTFRGLLVAPMGMAAAHLHRCAALARAVPVWRLDRPRDLALLGAVVDRVLRGIA